MAANLTRFTRANKQLTKIADSFSVKILIKNLPRAGFLHSTVRTCAKRWTVAKANCYCREKAALHPSCRPSYAQNDACGALIWRPLYNTD
jgi:hypothetical protein